MKNKRVYPVILTPADNIILVEVPDMEILTEGKDYQDAIEMARDAIGLKGITLEDAGKTIPDAYFCYKSGKGDVCGRWKRVCYSCRC